MKKIFIGFVMAALMSIGHVYAQYNNTYSTLLWGGYTSTKSIDIAETGNGDICMLGMSTNQYNNLIVLRQLDNMGNVLFETAHTHANIFPTKLLYTINGEYIVVGYKLVNIGGPSPSTSFTRQPFAAKFDNAGAFQWMEIYDVNMLYVDNDIDRVNVVYCADDPGTESYIVTFSADQNFYLPPSDAFGFMNEDVTIGALRFDASNGSLMWAKKYYQSAANRDPNILTRADYPHALAYGNGKYFIAGRAATSQMWSLPSYTTFMMSIDNTGNIVDAYKNVYVTNVDMYHDAIYDAGTNEFVMSFTGCALSVVATSFHVMKVDADPLNPLGINAIHYYYDNSGSIENYAFSIKETPGNDAYVVGGMISGGNYIGQSMADASAMLRVGKNTLPQYLKRYNVLRSHWPSAVASYINPNTGIENNAIGTTPNSAAGSDMRVIATDNTLYIACAELDRTIGYDQPPYTDYGPIPLDDASTPQSTSVLPGTPSISNTMTMCTNPPYHSYKTNSVADIENEVTINVYPTILGGNEDDLHFDITATGQTELMVTAVSVDGRTIGTYKAAIAQGRNKLSWKLPANIPGNYILNISSADNAIHKTERISKL